MREYFSDVTHGIIDIQGQVVGPFALPLTLASYANGEAGLGDALPNAKTMARDAVVAADSAVNFAPFDNDGDGSSTHSSWSMPAPAGSCRETPATSGQQISARWRREDGRRDEDFAFLTVPEDCRIGVCCHELGHLLFGFPDLYDTDFSSEGVGSFCLMGAGNWGGNGDTPTHPSAWCKANQGWASVINVLTNGRQSLEDVKASHKVFRLWKDGAPGSDTSSSKTGSRAASTSPCTRRTSHLAHRRQPVPQQQ